MTSNTTDLANLTQENKSINQRNAFSSVKRRPLSRGKIDITPINIKELFKETENEPLPTFTYTKHEEEEPSPLDVKKPHETPKLAKIEKNDSSLFPLTKLTTPAKSEISLNGRLTKPLEYQFLTPKNNIQPPKVQCSVKVKDLLKTPIHPKQDTTARKKVQFGLSTIDLLSDTTFKKLTIKNVKFLILNELGKGGSSRVYQCIDLKTKSHRAIKYVLLENPTTATGFINEVKMLQKLQNCDRIIKMYDFEILEQEKILFVIMEVGGADLSKILKDLSVSSTHLPLYMLIYYWMEMLYAVKQIHINGIIHSDLKPANFIKVEGYLKLIDFGISSCLQNDKTSVVKTVSEGSFNYISPEALKNEGSSNINSPSYGKPKYKLSYKSDVWSLGCILYQLIYRKTPFQHFTNTWGKLMEIVNPNHVINYPEVDWVPNKIINTVKSCLKYDMKSRPTVDELITEYENIFSHI